MAIVCADAMALDDVKRGGAFGLDAIARIEPVTIKQVCVCEIVLDKLYFTRATPVVVMLVVLKYQHAFDSKI